MTKRGLLLAYAAALSFGLPISGALAQSEAPATASPTDAEPAKPAAPAPYTPPAKAGAADPSAPAPADAALPAPEASATAIPNGDAAAAAKSLPTMIEDVQVVGPWTDGDKSGVWRTVMMQVGATTESYRFFVQQIEKAKGQEAVLSTTEIKEVPGIKGAIVGYRADEPSEEDAGGLSLFFDIVPSDGEIAETYELHFQKDTSYTFGPATN